MEIKERPILFSAPMVNAILEGRKTQTRRVVKKQPTSSKWKQTIDLLGEIAKAIFIHDVDKDNAISQTIKCPYGKPGDRLWVRETHARIPEMVGFHAPHYMADGHVPSISERHDAGLLRVYPSIHMPRWASRINLEITNIRVERVQDITPEDAEAEGIELHSKDGNVYVPAAIAPTAYVKSFRMLWDSINGKTFPWSDNPWVWVVEFKRVEDRH